MSAKITHVCKNSANVLTERTIKAADGSKILYDIDSFHEIEKAEGSVKSETTSTINGGSSQACYTLRQKQFIIQGAYCQ